MKSFIAAPPFSSMGDCAWCRVELGRVIGRVTASNSIYARINTRPSSRTQRGGVQARHTRHPGPYSWPPGDALSDWRTRRVRSSRCPSHATLGVRRLVRVMVPLWPAALLPTLPVRAPGSFGSAGSVRRDSGGFLLCATATAAAANRGATGKVDHGAAIVELRKAAEQRGAGRETRYKRRAARRTTTHRRR